MPLLTIAGLPLSGKTTRALEIQSVFEQYIQQHQLDTKIHIINDEFLKLDPKQSFQSPTLEKNMRATVLSAVERHLTAQDLVICDSLNYIKGFRYQLYCIARALATPTATLYVGQEHKLSLERNKSLQRYDDQIIDNLCTRFEEPDGRNRWDAPLFIVIQQDPQISQQFLGSELIDQLLLKKAPKPNLSTQVKPIQETNYLHELDKITSEITDTLIQCQKDQMSGYVVVPHTVEKAMLPSRTIPLQEFRKLKRQYVQMNKMHQQDLKVIGDGFVKYLNTNFYS
ncbi:chromatin associated protein KTI12 [Gorgonomyces haynaldii]|nr:chromatin associated protein KTI12 [Gorgonomyces haynaldii]